MNHVLTALRKAERQLSLLYDYGLIGEVYFDVIEELVVQEGRFV